MQSQPKEKKKKTKSGMQDNFSSWIRTKEYRKIRQSDKLHEKPEYSQQKAQDPCTSPYTDNKGTLSSPNSVRQPLVPVRVENGSKR